MKRKYTLQEVVAEADYHGLDLTLLHWRIKSEEIEDKHLAAIWEDAYQALKKVDDYLDKVVKRGEE